MISFYSVTSPRLTRRTLATHHEDSTHESSISKLRQTYDLRDKTVIGRGGNGSTSARPRLGFKLGYNFNLTCARPLPRLDLHLHAARHGAAMRAQDHHDRRPHAAGAKPEPDSNPNAITLTLTLTLTLTHHDLWPH